VLTRDVQTAQRHVGQGYSRSVAGGTPD
jgi:hypothetical protein